MAKVIMPRTRMGGSYPVAMPASHEDGPPAAPVVSHEHSERVLLLEDEEQTNLVLKEYLQSLGYRVVAVSNGVEGLKAVMKSDFELVICDMMMPRLPGDMFYIAVQKTRPHLCKRFVFITGHQATPTVGSFMADSEAAVLVKPFRLHQLEVTLENILSKFPHRPRPAGPLRIVRMPDDEEIHPEENVEAAAEETKKVPVPSMVMKALKVVGFLRGNSGEMPPPLSTVAQPVETPRITRRITLQSLETAPRKTRVIKTQASDTSRPKVTRRVSPPPLPASALPAASETQETAKPQVTRRVAASTTAPTKPQVSRRIPAPKIEEPAKPQVTLRVPSQTIRVPKTTIKIPRTTIKIAEPKAKVTMKVTAKMPASKPVVTRPVKPAVTKVLKLADLKKPKVTQKIVTTVKIPVKKQK